MIKIYRALTAVPKYRLISVRKNGSSRYRAVCIGMQFFHHAGFRDGSAYPLEKADQPRYADDQRVGGQQIAEIAEERGGLPCKSQHQQNGPGYDDQQCRQRWDRIPFDLLHTALILTVNVLPLPGSLLTLISPSIMSTTLLTSASPRPLPCVAWEVSP